MTFKLDEFSIDDAISPAVFYHTLYDRPDTKVIRSPFIIQAGGPKKATFCEFRIVCRKLPSGTFKCFLLFSLQLGEFRPNFRPLVEISLDKDPLAYSLIIFELAVSPEHLDYTIDFFIKAIDQLCCSTQFHDWLHKSPDGGNMTRVDYLNYWIGE